MRHGADQNASNLVGRNSGAGPGGISQIVPTDRERERGLEPLSLDAQTRGRTGLRLGLGLGALALAGAGVAAYAVQNQRRRRRLGGRLNRMVGWIS
jgi:hypothetical protein